MDKEDLRAVHIGFGFGEKFEEIVSLYDIFVEISMLEKQNLIKNLSNSTDIKEFKNILFSPCLNSNNIEYYLDQLIKEEFSDEMITAFSKVREPRSFEMILKDLKNLDL